MDNKQDIYEIGNPKYKAIRERWNQEDNLLISRTSLFLTASAILCAVTQFQSDTGFRLAVVIISWLLSFFWIIISWHSTRIIFSLYKACKTAKMPSWDKSIINIKPLFNLRPTTVFGKVIPAMIFIGWSIYLIWLMYNLFKI